MDKSHFLIPLLAVSGLLVAASVRATPIHSWQFDDVVNTHITQAANSGTTGGVLFEEAASATSEWKTSGDGRLLIQSNTGTTLHQYRANMGTSLTNGKIRFEHQVSWNFTTTTRGNPNEVYLITRPSSGVTPNLFRWTMENPSSSTNFRLNLDGAGITGSGLNNLTFNQGGVSLGSTGQIWLRADYTLSAAAITGIDAYWSTNGTAWNQVILAYAPQTVANIGDLRIHGKGNYDASNFHAINSVSVSVIPEPSTYAGIFGFLALAAAVVLRRRR
jgi:hypothetical protein